MNIVRYFPINIFASVMSLTGFSLSLRKLAIIIENNTYLSISQWCSLLSSTLFCLFLLFYALKCIFFRKEVREEWNHAIKLSFFPTVTISILLLSSAMLPFSKNLSFILWAGGAFSHFILFLTIISEWISHKTFDAHQLIPTWFIPAVGNLVIALTGTHHGFQEINWFFFSTGLIFFLILLPLVFNRLIFHYTMSQKFLPTLMILMAPSAISFLVCTQLIPFSEDHYFSKILFYSGISLFCVIVTQLKKFMTLPFSLAWWAYPFPLSAITMAIMTYSQLIQSSWLFYCASALLCIVSGMMIFLIIRTIYGFIKGELPETHS